MTTTTAPRARELPQTDPALARTNTTAEYAALVAFARSLHPGEWSRPTYGLHRLGRARHPGPPRRFGEVRRPGPDLAAHLWHRRLAQP